MLDICYYSSDYYAPYTGISMYSLLKNNADLPFRLHCIDCGISETNRGKMTQMAAEFEKEIVFHDYAEIESMIRDGMKLPDCNGSYATYIKFFPDRFFPDSDMLLFVDGDTIINGSIQALAETDMKDCLFSAAPVSLINESWVYDENDPKNLRYVYSLKFRETGYFNIGICLVNPKKWKSMDFGSRIMAEMAEHLDTITQVDDIPVDEMLINLAAAEPEIRPSVLPMSMVYNCIAHSIPFKRAFDVYSRCGYIDMDDFTQAYRHPVIIHFCIFKPWFTDAYSPYYPLVDRYRVGSLWPDAFKERKYHSIPQRIYARFFYPMEDERFIRIGKKAWRALAFWKK